MTEQVTILILSIPSGEQLIADVYQHDGVYLCKNVMQIISQPDEETKQLNMGMIQYMPFTDPDTEIAIPSSIAIIAMPNSDMREYYLAQFNDSVIITPPEPKIILS